MAKICLLCKKEKPLFGFYVYHRRNRLEHTTRCKECMKLLGRAYRLSHIDSYNATRRSYYRNNREKILSRMSRYNSNGRVRKMRLEAMKRYLKSEKGRIYTRLRNVLRRASGDITRSTIVGLFEESRGHCFYCGGHLKKGFEIDHVMPICKGGKSIWSNLVVTCVECNRKKSSKTGERYLSELLEAI